MSVDKKTQIPTLGEDLGFTHMGNEFGGGSFTMKNVIEDFMKVEYAEGFRNEFNTMDALINKLPKDTISGKVKYKTFAIGITDNVRAVGSGTYDNYELGMEDFYGKGNDTIDAQFDTTKLMATFAITDEAMLKGSGDGSLIDVLKYNLQMMETGLKHTYNRYIYGGRNGIIGGIKNETKKPFEGKAIVKFDMSAVTKSEKKDLLRDTRGTYNNYWYDSSAPLTIQFKMTNSHSLIEGMGVMIELLVKKPSETKKLDVTKCYRYIGRIWQKDNTEIHNEKIIFFVEKVLKSTALSQDEESVTAWGVEEYDTAKESFADIKLGDNDTLTVYSRQIRDNRTEIAPEYTGLHDIVVTQNNTIFGVNRAVVPSFNCVARDMGGIEFINEEILRDLSDHLALTSPDGTSISLVCANHRLISQVEKSLYQFKNYNISNVGQGMQLGGTYELRFDNYVLYKDKYARDNNVYMLDQQKIGELVRRDFQWITSGEVNGVLQRRPGTELYEGIMNKYADMYIDAWRCHGVLKDCAVNDPGQYLSLQSNGLPKSV